MVSIFQTIFFAYVTFCRNLLSNTLHLYHTRLVMINTGIHYVTNVSLDYKVQKKPTNKTETSIFTLKGYKLFKIISSPSTMDRT